LSKNIFKENRVIRDIYFFLQGTSEFLKFRPLLMIKQYLWFLQQYKNYRKMKDNEKFKKTTWFPCLNDNLSHTPLDPTYFFQDSWAAKHIYKLKPKHHYDVGSSAKTIGILSQFVPITMIDIRPIELQLENLHFKQGSILELPFEDNSIETLSSLCVVEHIGLGRYGDDLDPMGSEKAIKELKRIMKIGGIILLSIPVDSENKIYFNAHRAFTREYILELFSGFKILDEKYHYGNRMFDKYEPSKGFGTGMFMLQKEITCL
jgi:SAM-dependent methyltransferase